MQAELNNITRFGIRFDGTAIMSFSSKPRLTRHTIRSVGSRRGGGEPHPAWYDGRVQRPCAGAPRTGHGAATR